MELVEGPSLARRIESGPVPEPQVRAIGAQIADALAYVHAAGMVHRDVKPANILLGSDAGGVRARLTDFGIVRLIGDERLTRVDMTLGSASYLAPEQARGSSVGPPADVYAFGLTLIEALSGVRSFDGPALEAVAARLTSDPVVPPGLPAPWPGILRAMTARDPTARPPARRVAHALRGQSTAPDQPGRRTPVVAPMPVPVPAQRPQGRSASGAQRAAAGTPRYPDPQPRPAAQPRSGRGLVIAAGLVLLGLLILVGVVLIVSNSDGGSPSPGTTRTTNTPSSGSGGRQSAGGTAATTADTGGQDSAPASDTGPASAPGTSAHSSPSVPDSNSGSARSGPRATPTG